MKDKKEEKKEEKKKLNPKSTEKLIISDELIRWMTEGTDPNSAPRSDCG